VVVADQFVPDVTVNFTEETVKLFYDPLLFPKLGSLKVTCKTATGQAVVEKLQERRPQLHFVWDS